jgi:hypothetical protein
MLTALAQWLKAQYLRTSSERQRGPGTTLTMDLRLPNPTHKHTQHYSLPPNSTSSSTQKPTLPIFHSMMSSNEAPRVNTISLSSMLLYWVMELMELKLNWPTLDTPHGSRESSTPSPSLATPEHHLGVESQSPDTSDLPSSPGPSPGPS